MKKNTVAWIVQLVPALFMLQTIILYKFPAHPDSVYIFKTIGMEPEGRIGSGVVELIASLLLLIPRYSWIGALLGMGTMSGAIFFHLTTNLGVVVKNDGGFLFAMAIVIWLCCLAVLILRKKHIPINL